MAISTKLTRDFGDLGMDVVRCIHDELFLASDSTKNHIVQKRLFGKEKFSFRNKDTGSKFIYDHGEIRRHYAY
jgi:hypothetical protein